MASRSRVDEALPVVTGRSDDETANIVFPNWRDEPKFQARFNPFLELEQATRIRDGILHRAMLKPGHLVGQQAQPRHSYAQFELVRALATLRAWSKSSVEAYIGLSISQDAWDSMHRVAAA